MYNILLYNITPIDDMPNKAFVPLAYVLLEEYLKKFSVDVFRYDYIWDSLDNSEFERYYEYDIVGFQLTYSNADVIINLIEKWAKTNTKPLIVLGGVLASAIAKELLKRYIYIDVIVIAEGEDALLQLANKNDFKNIPGIVYRNNFGSIVYNKGQKPIAFDQTPIPKRNYLLTLPKQEIKKTGIRLQTARGCLGGCSFCNNSYKNRLDKITTKVWRGMSPERVVTEIEYLYTKYDVRIINFVDPSFEDPGKKGKKRIKEIAKLLIEKDFNISFKVNMRTETFSDSKEDMALLRLLKLAGMDVIILGLEASSNKELKIFGKNADVETNTKTYFRLKKMDCFFINVGYITIHPYSTIESLTRSFEYINMLGESYSFNIFMNALIPLRGTNIYDRLLKDNLIINPDDIINVPKYKFIDTKVADLNAAIQLMKVQHPIFPKIIKTIWSALNIIARTTNRHFEGMLSKNKINTAFKELKDFVNNAIINELGQKNYNLQKQMLELAEKKWNQKLFEKIYNESFISYIYFLEKQINVNIDKYVALLKNEGYDISILELKPWGAYCSERTKIGSET